LTTVLLVSISLLLLLRSVVVRNGVVEVVLGVESPRPRPARERRDSTAPGMMDDRGERGYIV
jgi:hypothetical protein